MTETLDLDPPTFLREVERRTGTPVSACFQCHKCSTGCPISPEMDFRSSQIIRLIHLGEEDEVLGSLGSAEPRARAVRPAKRPLAHALDGVKVLDLTPLFLSNRGHSNGPLYCRQDTHWSGVATVLAAEQIASEVRFEDEPGATIQDEWRTVEIAGDLWRALAEPSLAKERLSLRFVQTEPDPSSPVVLLGDSHTLVFNAGGDMHAEGAGLADQLALELGFTVDLVGVRGSGATAARINLLRRAQQTPDYWAKKRIVIWCFSAREFTESDGWRIVPIG